MFCEGGHFTLLPNVLKKIYGSDKGTALYGIAFSYTGLCAVLILFLQQYCLDVDSAKSFNTFFYICAALSTASIILLFTFFTEEQYTEEEDLKTNKKYAGQNEESQNLL